MTVSNSATDIVNLALDVIKTENINDVEIPGDDKAAAVANRWYDDVRQVALEGFPWVFASTRSAIPLNAAAPDFGFDDAYVLPNNYLSLNFIKYWDFPLSKWNYVIEDGNLYIDNSGAESLNIGYTFDQTVTVKYSSSFKMYLAYSLAEKIVYKLTGNAGLLGRITTGRKTEQVNAKAVNGKVNPPVAYRQSKLLEGRRVYGGSTITGRYAGQNGRT